MVYWKCCNGGYHKSVSLEVAKKKVQKEIDLEMLKDGYAKDELNKIETITPIYNECALECYNKPYIVNHRESYESTIVYMSEYEFKNLNKQIKRMF